jgi:membrane-bound lytic murein transglycosylase MltF
MTGNAETQSRALWARDIRDSTTSNANNDVKRIFQVASTVCIAICLAVASHVWAQKAPPAAAGKNAPAWYGAVISQKWTGDLDEMVKRRTIRALVVYSQSGYFVDKGTQRGASYEALVGFENDLNKQLNTKNLRINVVFIPVKIDDLIPALMDGRGDIAAAFITITPGRDKLIDFSDPLIAPINEVIVSGPSSPALATLDDLSGKEVFVHKSSSYYEHLQTLNAGLAKSGKPPVKILLASESLQIEDLLQMLNAGLVQFVVADDIKAKLWQEVLPNIKVRSDLVINSGGAYAWMVREKSPQLLQAINAFIKRHPNSDAGRGEVLRKYLKSTKYIKNSTSPQELQKFNATIEMFRRYSGQYSFDTLLMIAQGYQESRLDQKVHSPVGAVGVMQVMPETGRAMGVGNIVDIDPNIHAGVKYIASIRDKYFGSLPMDALNKTLFSFAAYNAGPNRILSLRGIAEKRGLNPNLWFDNVELIAAEKIGRETVTYVRNIFKYYIAYRLLLDRKKEHDDALKTTASK